MKNIWKIEIGCIGNVVPLVESETIEEAIKKSKSSFQEKYGDKLEVVKIERIASLSE